jgi:hypothetical protein
MPCDPACAAVDTLAAKIAVIVICAVSALIVVVLSAVYTKRAIDRRLASVHLEEEVHVEEQHYLLGSGSNHGDEETPRFGAPVVGAPAGEASTHRGVMISVETPMLVRRSSSAEAGSRSSQQQPLRTLDTNSQPSWGARVASRLGFGAGSSVGTRKVKVTDDFDVEDFSVPLHGNQSGSGSEGGSGVGSSSSASKATCINRNGH